MKVAIIVRGGLKIGMGHVSRCLTLADRMKDKTEILFFANRDQKVSDYIKNRKFTVYQNSGYSRLISKLMKINPDRVIIDRLDIEENFTRMLKENLQAKLIILGNSTTANKYAHVVINDIMGQYRNCRVQNLKYIDEYTNTLHFSGPKYVVLRKEFLDIKKRDKHLTDNIMQILLAFGGSDPSNLTTKVLNELIRSNRKYKINIILGTKFPWINEISCLINQYPEWKRQATIYQNLSDISGLMNVADLVICSLGTTFFEALYIGTPVIGISQNSNQTRWFEGFLPTLEKNQISRIGEIINNAKYINPNDEFVKSMEIGEGTPELVNAILGD